MAYNPSDHKAINQPFGMGAIPLNSKSLFFDVSLQKYRYFQNVAEVNTYFANLTFRDATFDIIVNTGGTLNAGVITGGTNDAYWYKDGTGNSNLVIKQTGGYSKSEIDVFLEAINTEIENHINNNNNPHSTTAAQVGAPTIQDLNNLQDSMLSADSELLLQIDTVDNRVDQEVIDRENAISGLQQELQDLENGITEDLLITKDQLELDGKTYVNSNLDGKDYSIYLDSVNRYLNIPDDYALRSGGGFILVYEMDDNDKIRLSGTRIIHDISEIDYSIKKDTAGNIDFWYGTYASVSEACSEIPNILDVNGDPFRYGKTVGIITDLGITEYWWRDGVLDTDLVPKIEVTPDELFYTTPNLIDSVTTGYWASSATSISTITASATLNHTNVMDCLPRQKFVIKNFSETSRNATAGSFIHWFDESGVSVFRMGSKDQRIKPDGFAWIVTTPDIEGIVSFGFNMHDVDVSVISCQKGNSVFDVTEKINPDFLLTPVENTSQLYNDSEFVYEDDLTPLRNKMQIIDNGAGVPDYGFVITNISGGLKIEWTGQILLSYSNDPSSSVNRYSNLIASSGTRSISIDSTNATTCYIKKSDFTGVTAEIIPVYYCRWGDDVMKDPNTLILITKNKSQSLKDCTGIFADFVRNSLNEKRITALENAAPENVAFLTSDNESQNLYLRGLAEKIYTTKKWGIISAGQSNDDGRVPQSEAPAWLNQSDPTLSGVKMWNRGSQLFADFKLGVNSGADSPSSTLWAFDMVLYHLLQDHLNDDIYAVKRSRGGCAISPFGTNGGGYWDAYFERVPSGIVLMDSLEQQIRAAMASTSVFEFKAFVWHQGEGDFSSPANSDYYQNFKNVIAYVRGIVDNPKLPVIYGSISTVSAQFSQIVKDAQIKIAQEDPYCYFIDMGAAPLLDAYHFNAASSESLGTQMFDIIKDL